jgi:hypothetical protein
MNSYRGEFAGLQDLTTWLIQTNLHTKRVQIGCDNYGCVKMLQYLTTELTDLDKAEADLISSITRANLAKFTDVEVVWVKGHQDDNTPYDDLPLLAQLNVDCDTAAKKHLREGTHPTSRPAPLPDAKATLFFGTNMVTTEINEQIQYAAQAPDWIDTQLTTVNFTGLGRAKKRLTRVRSIRTTKWIFGWFNIDARSETKNGGGRHMSMLWLGRRRSNAPSLLH